MGTCRARCPYHKPRAALTACVTRPALRLDTPPPVVARSSRRSGTARAPRRAPGGRHGVARKTLRVYTSSAREKYSQLASRIRAAQHRSPHLTCAPSPKTPRRQQPGARTRHASTPPLPRIDCACVRWHAYTAQLSAQRDSPCTRYTTHPTPFTLCITRRMHNPPANPSPPPCTAHKAVS